MICRIWRGWTTPENADAYHKILTKEVMPEIAARKIEGLQSYQCMRRDMTGDDGQAEVEFTTIMYFDAISSVKKFVGDEYEKAHVPDKPRSVLKRFESHSKHYELFENIVL